MANAIYAALTKKDGPAVRRLCRNHQDGPFLKLTQRKDSVLQKALYSTQLHLVRDLLEDAQQRWPHNFHKLLGGDVNSKHDSVLHVAATHDSCIPAATKILEYAPHLIARMNNTGESPIYIAVRYGQLKMFKFLYGEIQKLVPDGEYCLSSIYRRSNKHKSQTILHEAIEKEHFELALHIAHRFERLICIKNHNKMTGLHMLAMNPSAFRNQDWKWLKLVIPSSFRSLSAKEILQEDATDENVEGAAGKRNNNIAQAFFYMKFVLCTYVFKCSSSCLSKTDDDILHKDVTEENVEGAAGKIESSFTIPWWGEMKRKYRRYEAAVQLGSILVKKDIKWIDLIDDADADADSDSTDSDGSASEADSSNKPVKPPPSPTPTPPTPLILATKYGCLEIAKMILEEHPQTVEQVSQEHGSILHLPIRYQRIEIFKAVMKMEMQMRKLVRLHDQDENSILHMVALNSRKVKVQNSTKATSCGCDESNADALKAKSPKVELPNDGFTKSELTKAKSKLLPWDAEVINDETRSPAFELQDDLLLFKGVERILKTHYHKTLNNKLQTADQLFAAEKEELRMNAQEWMKRTSENCSIVAVLIATVAFAAAYTLPGGTDESKGFPVLRKEPFFVVFTAADVLSLASTLTAVVVFLSILTSSFRFHDFKESLPKKLMIGISCLVFSLTMMMLAFAATIILMIKDNQEWTKIALYTVAFLPVTVLVSTYLPFYVPLVNI